MHTKLLLPSVLLLISIPFNSLAQDAAPVDVLPDTPTTEEPQKQQKQKETISTNFSGLFRKNALEPSDAPLTVAQKSKGVFGIEAGAAVEGDGTSGAVFWYLERQNMYGLKIGFNIGSTVDVDADYSNLGDIIRNADEFGQFTFTGARIINLGLGEFAILGGVSYSQLAYNDTSDTSLDDGGVIALKLGVLLSSSTFDFSNDINGTVGLSLAYEHRNIVGDLSNNNTQLNSLFQGNGKSYNGFSTQLDINMSTNQRYFVKLTHFNADGLNGLDGTQISVGLKIDGILVN